MKKGKTLIFNNKLLQKTWIVNLRRVTGKPVVRYVKDAAGKKLKHYAHVVGDKLIVELKNGPSVGKMKISLKGDRALYLYEQNWWEKVKSFFSRLFRRKV